jgi:CDGSH-type Zn-finger protein
MSATITIIENGPAIIQGIEEGPVVTIHLEDGTTKQTTTKYAICRCGKTGTGPFCDGSHAIHKEDLGKG